MIKIPMDWAWAPWSNCAFHGLLIIILLKCELLLPKELPR